MPMSESRHRGKILIGSVALLVAVALGAALTAFMARPTAHAGVKGTITLKTTRLAMGSGYLVFQSTVPGPDFGMVAERPLPVGAAPAAKTPTVSSIKCDRSYTAAGTLLCLRTDGSMVRNGSAEIYDSSLKPVRTVATVGQPNRARVSADGRMASWTTFVAGDAYVGPPFSTRTSILDVKTGAYVASLESFAVTLNGKPYRNVDENFWGVSFAADDNTFYATLGTGGGTWLVRGDLAARTVTALVSNVECPSLSPDGKRLVFKKKVSGDILKPWRFEVLDLATLAETPLAEQRSVDDQAAWLDDDTVMYAVPQAGGNGGYDVWSVPADGSGKPTLLAPDAFSPSVTSG